jgi:dihydrolipoamide dehydrogenase
VTGLDGKNETISAKKSIIATGSEATAFPGLTFDEKIIVSSTGALSFPAVPKDLIVIGGGVIGLEMASIYQRFGTNVVVIEYLDEIVPALDKEIARNFNKILTKQGIKILTSHKVVSGKNHGTYGEVTIEPVKGGERQVLKADHILVATGRRPHTDKLGLDRAGVKVDEKGRVIVNDHLETNVPGILAIGDVVRGAMLAHKAEEEGIFAAEYLAGRPAHINYNAIPGVIYTYPEVASVGYTEEELIAKSNTFTMQKSSTTRVFSPSWPTPAPRPSPTPTEWSRSWPKRRPISCWEPISLDLVRAR